jgi:hypothetical protein
VRSEKGVLSVYFDLDPSVFPTVKDRRTEIDVLVSEAEDAFVSDDLDLGHEERKERVAAVQQLRELLRDPEIARGGTRSIAAFAAPAEDVFEVVRLDEPVPPTVIVDDVPYLRPLADQAGPQTWAVLLCDRVQARVLYGGSRRLVEVASFSDPEVRHQKSGGWSQARYQRHSDDAARDHIDHTVQRLLEFFEGVRFDALAIAAPDPTYNEIVDALHPWVRQRLRGRVRIEIGFPTPAKILQAASPVFEAERERAVKEILEKIDDVSRDQVAVGAGAVLQALNERRVDTLVIEERLELEGVRCPKCSWTGLVGDRCPLDEKATVARTDIVSDAVELALLQSAHVVNVAHDAEHHATEPMTALLRF